MNVKDFFELAQLAEAGYASYEKFDTPKAALINREFSDTQAELFLANWAVVNGGYRPNTDSG
ncbi:MAG: hypothetical protein NHG36_05060, partial [Chromatiaceae bacterium]|nr:hypothetical protein [Candidatus Thioaporhodococcus sediminis]